MSDLLDRLTSRKFLLALAACAYIAVQIAGGSVSTTDGLDAIWKIVAAYLGAEGAADALGRLKPSIPSDPAPEPLAATPQ